VRGSLHQGIEEGGVGQRKHRRPRGHFGFQALVALHAAGDVEDGFALFPDQGHTVDAAIALIEQGHIVDEAIGLLDPTKPHGPLTHAENREKLFARRRHRCHAHQPTEHDGHEPAPPQSLQVHPLVLHPVGSRLGLTPV